MEENGPISWRKPILRREYLEYNQVQQGEWGGNHGLSFLTITDQALDSAVDERHSSDDA